MNQLRRLGAVCVCIVLIAASSIATASPVSVTSNRVVTRAYDDAIGSLITNTSYSRIIPTTESVTATTGDSNGAGFMNYFGGPNYTTFSVDMSHRIDNSNGFSTPGFYDLAQTYDATLNFRANVNTTYSISGFYDMLGPAETQTLFDAYLLDTTTLTYLFQDTSESRRTANESFILGVAGDADARNNTIGSITGNLIAGHSYVFGFDGYIQSVDFRGNESAVAASATGNVTLTVGTVPVPAAAWLFGSGLLGMIGIARRNKAA